MRGKISLPVFYRKKVFLETSSGVVVCSSSNRFHVYDQVLLDGIYLAYRWCLITAINWEKIIAWQWCQRENSAAYQALMNRLLAPGGGRLSIAKALEICWSKKPLPAANAPIGPTGYDTAIDHDTAYQDGSLHIRKVWARR